MRFRSETKRRKGFGEHPETWAYHDRVGVDESATCELDRRDAPVVAHVNTGNRPADYPHPRHPQDVELGALGFAVAVEHDGESRAQLAEQHGRVEARFVSEDL